MTNLLLQSVDFAGVDFAGVDFEVCEAFRAAIEHDEPVCASCGHLADDHARPANVRRATVRRATVRRAA